MLREDIVAAVTEGKFSIYPVTHVDEGIEILTGVAAGEKLDDGRYPEGTINGLAVAKLIAMSKKQKKYSSKPDNDKNPEE